MKYLKYNGKRMCIRAWAREMGLTPGTLGFRLKAGWSIERALTDPPLVNGRKPKVAQHPHIADIQARIAKSHAALTEHMQRELRAFLKNFSDALVLHAELASTNNKRNTAK
jgi:hypothetical protein